MSQSMKIKYLAHEYWYGLCVEDGYQFPLSKASVYKKDIDPNTTCNQAAALLLSNKGRFVYCASGIEVLSEDGILEIQSKKKPVELHEGYETLKGAYLAASELYFPPHYAGVPTEFFTKPCYNTWIELMYEQREEKIIAYAEQIISNGYDAGILMIDDGWCEDYGVWAFHGRKFKNPKGMVKKLHDMGFQVMLWVCPFVSPDSETFRELSKKECFIKNVEGKPIIKEWWNGYSAILDFSNPDAQEWFHSRLNYLMDEFGVDGFKFDAGDGYFYEDSDCTFGHVDANRQIQLYMELGSQYPFNEFRVSFHNGGMGLIHRIADKKHSWDYKGMASLIPNQLAQGLLGYPFSAPDMIGGGEYTSFLEQSETLDMELFVRYAQCAALMPIMQYSAAPWRVLDKKHAKLCLEAAQLRAHLFHQLDAVIMQTYKTGEPVTRYMEYEFPNEGMEEVTDQFMVGSDLLVAPILLKNQQKRTVKLPQGIWKYIDGTIYQGSQRIEICADIQVLPYFTKEESDE